MNVEQRIGVAPEVRKPERMHDQELGNLLAAVGNHEGKALLLARMQWGQEYGTIDLAALVKPVQGEGYTKPVPFKWCGQSLAPIGLVAKGDGSYYGITEKGETVGKALAGHLLTFSLRHPEVSLNQLLGATSSSAKRKEDEDAQDGSKLRTPLTRYRTFYELLTRDLPIRWTDVDQALHESCPQDYASLRNIGIDQHLDSLSTAGHCHL